MHRVAEAKVKLRKERRKLIIFEMISGEKRVMKIGGNIYLSIALSQ